MIFTQMFSTSFFGYLPLYSMKLKCSEKSLPQVEEHTQEMFNACHHLCAELSDACLFVCRWQDIEKVCVCGGHLDHNTDLDVLREKGGFEVKVLLLNNAGKVSSFRLIQVELLCVLPVRHVRKRWCKIVVWIHSYGVNKYFKSTHWLKFQRKSVHLCKFKNICFHIIFVR